MSQTMELALSINGHNIQCSPIKGTRPRSRDKHIDNKYYKEITTSTKEHSENLMITDMVRNEIIPLCLPHEVSIKQYAQPYAYKSVWHLVSTITGILKPGLDFHHIIDTLLPFPSIVGAPRIAAMNLINKLEREDRGLYTGAIGIVDKNGTSHFAVAIRCAHLKPLLTGDYSVKYGSGGGITSQSSPEEEINEVLIKASGFSDALDTFLKEQLRK